MQMKTVQTSKGKWRVKVRFLWFFWVDPGFPSYDTETEAQQVVEEHSD